MCPVFTGFLDYQTSYRFFGHRQTRRSRPGLVAVRSDFSFAKCTRSRRRLLFYQKLARPPSAGDILPMTLPILSKRLHHEGSGGREISNRWKAIITLVAGFALLSLFSSGRLVSQSEGAVAWTTSMQMAMTEKQVRGASTTKLADGCHHVFIDAGANLGVHGRFLLEPHRYPDATVAHEIFNKHFGLRRDNRDLCVFAFEPNPAHAERHLKLAAAYEEMGWRYHSILKGVGSKEGHLTFYHNNDNVNEEFGFGINKLAAEKSTPVEVPVVKLSKWLEDEVYDRMTPAKVYGTYANSIPRVVIKVDIEGSENEVLPDLMFTGIMCKTVDYAFGEFHDWTPVNASTDRGDLKLAPRRETAEFARYLLKVFHSVWSESCKTEKFDLLDDESYLHDGPLWNPTFSKPETSATVSMRSNRTSTAIICAIVKDEEKYLEEWTRYHIGLGFSKIYIYDNSLNHTAQHWLTTMDDDLQSSVHVHDFSINARRRQLRAYTNCISTYARPNNHTWAAFYDPDEFLVLKQHENVVDFLQSTCLNGSVAVNWVTFGSSNQTTYQDIPVTERFLYSLPRKLPLVKTIVRVSDFVRMRSPHWAYLKDEQTRRDSQGIPYKGKWISGTNNPTFLDNGPTHIAALHHYYYKSKEEFRFKLCSRGNVWDNEQCSKIDFEDTPPGYEYNDWALRLLRKNVPKYRIVD